LGFGYRAEFIQRTAEMLVNTHGSKAGHDKREASEKWLMTLRQVSTSDARDELLKFVGVGRKVADCILLMSLDKVGLYQVFVSSIAAHAVFYRKKSYLWTPMYIKSQSSTTICVPHQAPRQT
jgi:hypothetical protein